MTTDYTAPKKVSTDDCWLFAGSTNYKDYGMVYTTHENFMVHRVAYEKWVGEIHDGFVIDHLCRIRICINPDHLEAVTPSVNTLRVYGKDTCKQGHSLDDDNVYVSKAKRADGTYKTMRRCATCARERDRIRRAA